MMRLWRKFLSPRQAPTASANQNKPTQQPSSRSTSPFDAAERSYLYDGDLIDAAGGGNTKKALELLSKGANANAKLRNGRTVLMAASFYDLRDLVQALLDKGANVDSKDQSGGTALMAAARRGHVQVTQMLLGNGAKVNAQAHYDGTTALLEASQNGHLEVVRVLIAAGADVSAKDNSGLTACDWAEAKGHNHVAELLRQLRRSKAAGRGGSAGGIPQHPPSTGRTSRSPAHRQRATDDDLLINESRTLYEKHKASLHEVAQGPLRFLHNQVVMIATMEAKIYNHKLDKLEQKQHTLGEVVNSPIFPEHLCAAMYALALQLIKPPADTGASREEQSARWNAINIICQLICVNELPLYLKNRLGLDGARNEQITRMAYATANAALTQPDRLSNILTNASDYLDVLQGRKPVNFLNYESIQPQFLRAFRVLNGYGKEEARASPMFWPD